MIIRVKKLIPPEKFGRYPFTDQFHVPVRLCGTRIFLIMLIQHHHCRIDILQSDLIILIHIRKISCIGIIRCRIEQILISGISSNSDGITILQYRRKRVVQTRSHSHREQQAKQHANHLTYPWRQAEIETASLSRLTFYIEHTYPEQFIRLLIFLNDSFTIHQAETASLVLFQFFRICRIFHADSTRIIYLFTNDMRYIFRRNPPTVVFHRYFHIRIGSMCIYFHRPSFGSIFTGVFSQCVNHKQGQRTVSLHHKRSRFNLQLLLFHLEGTPSLSQQIK